MVGIIGSTRYRVVMVMIMYCPLCSAPSCQGYPPSHRGLIQTPGHLRHCHICCLFPVNKGNTSVHHTVSSLILSHGCRLWVLLNLDRWHICVTDCVRVELQGSEETVLMLQLKRFVLNKIKINMSIHKFWYKTLNWFDLMLSVNCRPQPSVSNARLNQMSRFWACTQSIYLVLLTFALPLAFEAIHVGTIL